MKQAVLFIHGLSAKNEDNKYFIERMNKYSNIDLFTFILPGHHNDQVTKVKYNDWLDACDKEINMILKKYNKLTIVAHSMGCILATYLSIKYSKNIKKMVLISPAFLFGSLKQNKEDLKNLIRKNVNENSGTGFEGFFDKLFNVPKSVMLEYKVMANKYKKNISDIKCPVLIIHGDMDNVISVKSSVYVYNNLKTKKDLLIVKEVRHQVFKSFKKKQITDYIYRYITFNIFYKLSKKQYI